MRKRGEIALAVCLVGIGSFIVWRVSQIRGERDPVYAGKRLSVWLRSYQVGIQSPDEDKALRGIGTNAIPMLLKLLSAKDSTLQLRLILFAQKYRLAKIDYVPAQTLRMRAYHGFAALGGTAKDAVPELIEMYRHAPWAGPWGPGGALGEIGPAAQDALPYLILNAGSSNQGAREIAFFALGKIRGQPDRVIPVLIKGLSDPATFVRWQALLGLARYGQQTDPRLIRTLYEDPNPGTRVDAAKVLGQRHVQPEAVVPVLLGWLHETNSALRAGAARALKEYGKEGEPAVIRLTQLLDDEDPSVRDCATDALKAIDPEAAAKSGVK